MNDDLVNARVLSIAPSARGFGFAVMEGQRLINWGGKNAQAKGETLKNQELLGKVDRLIGQWQPAIVMIEDVNAKCSRRRPRIKQLILQIAALAESRRVRVKLLSRAQLKKAFSFAGKGTKYEIAILLTKRFPHELAHRLQPKRKPWQTEKKSTDVFDAVAFGVAVFLISSENPF